MTGSRCVVQDCENNHKTGKSLRLSPKSGPKKAEWIRLHSKNFNPLGRFVVCSDHFERECYHFGEGSELKRYLIKGSVPTIWKPKKTIASPSDRELRQRAKEIKELLATAGDSGMVRAHESATTSSTVSTLDLPASAEDTPTETMPPP
ncbi:uncharacterized protein LOC116606214 [Nematostella vectensis]|uniref:uncharacterized protein LOC116606214 n=1 Tax=Nematostella vectensis TaxID=45351 RepID=UPI00139042CB|nr:uncharacterized protein LOC116606214 [Nematostella vectensis]